MRTGLRIEVDKQVEENNKKTTRLAVSFLELSQEVECFKVF